MSKMKYFTIVALAAGSATAFAAEDRSFHVQNTVRVGYDDNVYQTRDDVKQDTAYVSDVVNLSGKLVFSDRSELTFYWQPEFRYRFDADPKSITYQDLYARLSHAISQRTFLELSDRFRYQEKDGQSDISSTTENQNFIENNLLGALTVSLNTKSQAKLGGGYKLRQWDDNTDGKTQGNNFDQFTVDGSYVRELRPNTTHGMAGVNYVTHDYDGPRGGYDSTTLYVGADHNFSPTLIGNANVGYSFSSVEGGGLSGMPTSSSDTSSPYLQAGLEYNPTERTSINGTLGYSLSATENSVYNAQDQFSMGLGARHDLTGKITLSSVLSYIYSSYDSKYSSGYGEGLGFTIPDAQENYTRLSIRGSYQINRNNFIDLGYELSYRDSPTTASREYTRNRVDLGWRLRL